MNMLEEKAAKDIQDNKKTRVLCTSPAGEEVDTASIAEHWSKSLVPFLHHTTFCMGTISSMIEEASLTSPLPLNDLQLLCFGSGPNK